MMRRNPTSQLAFIDIMSCGLGAVILILVLLKNQQPTANDSYALDHTALDEQIATLLTQQQATKAQNEIEQSTLSQLDQEIDDLKARQSVIASIKTSTQSMIERLESKIQSSQKILSTQLSEQKIKTKTIQHEDYLIGLNIEGQRIAILVDSSASMTARELITITNYKVQSEAKRRSAAKWQRTLSIVQWLIARAPEDSELLLMSFSDQATIHTQPEWISLKDKKALAVTQNAMQAVTPGGPTNLEQAIAKVLKQRPDTIYLITDGLPTQGLNKRSILSSGGCGGMATKKKISGECRVTLLRQAAGLTQSYRGKLSIILLPLEGDPQAAPELSNWVLNTGGTLISPAASWP